MSNAALYIHPDAYDTTGARLMGRHSAGESFLRGFLRHAEVDAFHLWNVRNQPLAELEAMLRRHRAPDRPRVWHSDRQRLGDAGVLNLPVPGIAYEAWARRSVGDQAYAICGITHTTASDIIMRSVADLLLSPAQDYDALICTSSVVLSSVETILDGARAYLAKEYGPRRRSEPLRTVIPLGVNVADFAVSAAQRKAWRARLDIPEDAIVALYVGRFEPRVKMNPALMALALEQAARRTTRPLYWLNSGWGESEAAAAQFHENTRTFCPSVHYRHVDGRPADVRFSIWSAADLFISFSDNIQETFGLTPVEAMAAGLPCVVTDWNGYRDTVRHGEDGFRIPTYAPGPGAGGDLAYAYADSTINYHTYVGGAAQYTAIDLAAAAQAIVDLAENADLRQRMGAQARAQAMAAFDWSAIVPQYQALWAEQDARRRVAPAAAPAPGNPFRPDPFTLFHSYPTRHLRGTWTVSAPPGVVWSDVEPVLTSPLAVYSAINRPALADCAKIFDHLAHRGPSTVAEAVAQFPAGHRPFMQRGILWMARFGAVTLTPTD